MLKSLLCSASLIVLCIPALGQEGQLVGTTDIFISGPKKEAREIFNALSSSNFSDLGQVDVKLYLDMYDLGNIESFKSECTDCYIVVSPRPKPIPKPCTNSAGSGAWMANEVIVVGDFNKISSGIVKLAEVKSDNGIAANIGSGFPKARFMGIAKDGCPDCDWDFENVAPIPRPIPKPCN